MNSAELLVGGLLGVCRSDQRCGADPRKAGENAAPAMDLWHENLPYLLTSFRLAFLFIEDTPIQGAPFDGFQKAFGHRRAP